MVKKDKLRKPDGFEMLDYENDAQEDTNISMKRIQ